MIREDWRFLSLEKMFQKMIREDLKSLTLGKESQII